jgi:hypothetical protein
MKTRLQEFVDRCDACYMRRKGFAIRLVIKVGGCIVDIEVQRNDAGLQCLNRQPGLLACDKAMTYAEAVELNTWIKYTFWNMPKL